MQAEREKIKSISLTLSLSLSLSLLLRPFFSDPNHASTHDSPHSKTPLSNGNGFLKELFDPEGGLVRGGSRVGQESGGGVPVSPHSRQIKKKNL